MPWQPLRLWRSRDYFVCGESEKTLLTALSKKASGKNMSSNSFPLSNASYSSDAASTAKVVSDGAVLRSQVCEAQALGRRVGFVPTMGALHEGHASLVRAAVAECDDVIVSIFVNPTQFAPGEDFQRYPRLIDADIRLLNSLGVRWIFVPGVLELYRTGESTRVEVHGPSARWEGAMRAGHFSGVATVVLKLFMVAPANVAYFGAKDFQQTVIVRQMVADLFLPIRIVVHPTVREADGVAMSSRNVYLSPQQRVQARAFHESLCCAERLWRDGASPDLIAQTMCETLSRSQVVVDYAVVVDPETLELLETNCHVPRAVALVAGRLGQTRLIDNRELLTNDQK